MLNFLKAFVVTVVASGMLAALTYFITVLLGKNPSPVSVFVMASLAMLYIIYPTLFAVVASVPVKDDKNKKP